MSDLRRKIESLPPGLILIQGRAEVAEFLHALPRNILSDLHKLGYRFFVVPEGVSIEALPDEVLEQMYLMRQSAKIFLGTNSNVH
jgi:hypothetical protein